MWRSSRLALSPAVAIALACAGLAALSLLVPSTPTYDPWAWIIWGREVAHLDLSTTLGPSWKPLPVAITTVASLFGGAAPALWLVAARAGALAGVVLAFRVARRLAGGSSFAGLAAAAGLLLAPWYVRNAALGNSEGLQVAFALAAIDQALAGRPRRAFLLGAGLGLLRPEAWPFVLAYGAWLVWRERRALPLVAAGLMSLPLLWLVPEKLGSGDWMRAADRARDTVHGAAAGAPDPVTTVLRGGWGLLSTPLHWLLPAALAVALWRRDRRVLAVAALAVAWTLLVAAMTARGYSGNPRYLVVPAAVAIVVAVAGAASALAGRFRPAGLALAVAVGLPWVGAAAAAVRVTTWQARMTGQLATVVAQAGGRSDVLACGPVVTNAYLVPAVAWRLDLRIDQVGLLPGTPGTVLRVHKLNDGVALPTLTPLAGAPVQTLAASRDWRIVSTCQGGSR
jgi:hypothetical protein